MTAREVVLDGGSPWGFRMHGGADVGQALRISRVNPGSKAALKGVREGDVISSINGQSTRNVSNSDAHALLRNAGQTLHLGLNEECSGSPKRRNFRNTAQNDAGRQRVGNGITTANTNTLSGSSGKVNGNAQGESKLDNEGVNAKGRRGRRCRSRRRRGRAAQVRRAASAAVDQVLEEAVTRVASRLEEVVWETAEDILPGPCPPPRNVPAVLVDDYDEPEPSPPSMPPHEERRLREFLQSLEIVKRADEAGRTAPEPSRRSRRRAVAEHFTRRSRSLDVILEEPSEGEKTDEAVKTRTSPRNRNYSLGEETLGEVCKVKESFIAKSHVEELVSFQQSLVTTWQKEEPQECNRVVIAEVEDTDTETGTPGEEGSVEMVASEDDVDEIDFEPTHSVEIVCASSPSPPPKAADEDSVSSKNEPSDRTADVVLKLLEVLPKQDSTQSSMYTVLSQLTIGQIASLSSGFKKNIEAMLESTTTVVSEGEVSSEGGDDEATPPQGHSRQGSSSSDATSHNTAVFYPSSTPEPCFQPPSLRVAALKVVLALPGGSFLLSELEIGCNTPVFSPTSSIPPTPPPLPHYFSPASMSPSGSSWISTPPAVPTPPPLMSPPHPQNPCWTGIQSRDDPRLYVCLSPAQTDSYDAAPDADALLDLHQKFMWRRSYNEQFSPASRSTKNSQLPPTPPSRRARHGLLHSREWEASSHKAHVMGPPDAAKIPTAAAAGSSGGGEDAGRPQRGAADARGAASRAAMMKLDAAAACGGGCCARNSDKDEEQRLKAQMLSEWLSLARTVPDVVQASSSEDTQRRVYRVNSVDSSTQGKDEVVATERRLSFQETDQKHQSRPPLPQSSKRVHQQNTEAQRYLQKLRERHQKHQLEEEERILRERLLMEAPLPSHNRLQEIREQVVAHVKDYSHEGRQLPIRLKLETRENILQNHVDSKSDTGGKGVTLQKIRDCRERYETEVKSVDSYEISKAQRSSDEADAQKNKGIANESTRILRGPPLKISRIEETTNVHQDCRVVRGQTSQAFSLRGGDSPSVQAEQKSNKNFNSNAEVNDLSEFSKQFTEYNESSRMDQQIPTRVFNRKTLHEEPQVIVNTERKESEGNEEVEQHARRFEANKYKISKRGDIAVIQEGAGVEPTSWGRRPKSLPPATDGELFRQQMYHEYMAKVAELAERQRQKVIRLSMRPEDLPSATPAEAHLEAEFMGRVRQMGLAKKGDSDDEGGVGAAVELPKHLQELLDAAGSLLLEIDAALRRSARGFLLAKGVWTPKSSATPEPTPQPELQQQQDEKKDNQQQDVPQQPVWTPAASPTSERRFRPVNFTASLQVEDSTKQTSSSSSSSFIQQTQSQTSEIPVLPPWKQPEEVVSRLVQSQSAPASGLSSLTKLPRAQNPTITLLQKAREGQLPKGALYLDHKMTSKEMEKATFGQHEILYTVKKEYEKEMDGQRKKIAELGPRKFEGIGPTTKEGIPIVLRSEVKDTNQAKWYKRMYDSLHRTGKDDDFITIRYRPRRGHYPYTSAGGYLSEPEPGSYDSDVGYTTKYATLDRRRIKNKENDFTTSTVPRSKYVPHPSSIKYATEIYKNQPGRIEDYEPGHSSISDRETKQWWDEVLDIFDGWLDSHSGTPTYRSLLADAMYHKAANEQLQATTPSGKPFMTYALKESGYESDSTLVFKRRDDNLQNQLSPAEQKLAYKTIQKGGEVPLHGLRKPAPERPKDAPGLEYFPLSPHLTRIHVAPLREITCYPVTTHPTNPPPVFSSYKRTAPSFVCLNPAPPPCPPRRLSSRHNSTLRMWSLMSTAEQPKVKFLRDRLASKMEAQASPSRSPSALSKSPSSGRLSRSPDLASPGEVRRALQRTKDRDVRERPGSRVLPPGTIVRSSTAVFASAKNSPRPSEDKSLRVTVAMSARGRELLRASSTSPRNIETTRTRTLKNKPLTSSLPSTMISAATRQSPVKSPPKKVTRAPSYQSLDTAGNKRVKKLEKAATEAKKRPKEKTSPKSGVTRNTKSAPDAAAVKDKKKVSKKSDVKRPSPPPAPKSPEMSKDAEKRRSRLERTLLELDDEPESQFGSVLDLSGPTRSDKFFQHLLLRDLEPPPTPPRPLARSTSVLERARRFHERGEQLPSRSEPQLGLLSVYLASKRPVSESKFRSLDRVRPSQIPLASSRRRANDEERRSVSEPPPVTDTPTSIKLSTTSSPKTASPTPTKATSTSPTPTKTSLARASLRRQSPSPASSARSSPSPSPSSRRIRGTRTQVAKTVESVAGPKKVARARSAGDAEDAARPNTPSSPTQAMSSTALNTDQSYRAYVLELLHSTRGRKSERFRELHRFYASLERVGQLERTTSIGDLRPRRRGEEIVDFDRWKQLRARERAEVELRGLYERLEVAQKERDLLFRPRDASTLRWRGDRGLRCKERSVEDIREHFARLTAAEAAAEMEETRRRDADLSKDTYKPLWRGASVLDLASSLRDVVGSHRGRAVSADSRPPPPPTPSPSSTAFLKKHFKGIGSHIWSSLSMEQVNALKSQLTEIYGTSGPPRRPSEKYEIAVSGVDGVQSPGADALHVRCNSLLTRDQLYSPTVRRREAARRGADSFKAESISSLPHATRAGSMSENEKRRLSMTLSQEILDRAGGNVAGKCKSETPDTVSPRTCYSLEMSEEAASASSQRGGKNDFLLVLTPQDSGKCDVRKVVEEWAGGGGGTDSGASSEAASVRTVIHRGKLCPSQSCADLKELFGESSSGRLSTPPPDSSRGASPDPSRYWRAYLRVARRGEVRRLRDRFESPRRWRSDPELARALLAGRARRSPVPRVPLRADARYMPHINVISKVASLLRASRRHASSTSPPPPLPEGGKGEVRRLRNLFEGRRVSLLGQMFTSTPDVRELRHIAPFLGCSWVAHRHPEPRSRSSPELRPPPSPTRPRAASASPVRYAQSKFEADDRKQLQRKPSPTGKDAFADQHFDPSIHRPAYRYQPPYRPWTGYSWHRAAARPCVTFQEPAPPARSTRDPSKPGPRRSESPHRYVESEVTIHYRSPVRSEAKEVLSEEELARRQAEAMRRIYQEERRRKYLQELQDMHSRRHTDNFTPSQKSPIPLNRYDDFLEDSKSKPRDRTPEPKLVARALYNFVGQTSRELTFRRGDIIFVRRQIDKNWYEGEHNAMVGLFPLNYVEIIPYDGIRTIPKRPSEGQAKAKFNFIAQTHLELSLVKGELVVLTRRVDDNWYEGRIGARKGIFPVSYVEVLQEPGDKKGAPATTSKPATTPTVHSVLVNGSGLKQQPYYSQKITSQSYTSSSPYATLPRQGQTQKQPLAPVNQTLHIDTHQEPVPYRALYNYRPQNEDELELREGDTVYVMEKCDDGWYVGSSQRTGFFGTFPGNYVERLL